MVLRGQPVGEQGAADRWTALDPYIAGSGAGGAAGDPLRGAPFLSLSPYEFAGPSGALFACRGGRRSRAAPVLLHSLLIGKKKGPFRVPVLVVA